MSTSRRMVAGLIRIGLVILLAVFIGRWFTHKTFRTSKNASHMSVETNVPATDSALGPGDMRILNADSSVDLILQGNNILAGLSPKTVAKVRSELDTSGAKDGSGLGGSISRLVKSTVANAISTHASFPLADLRDIRYENRGIVFDWNDGTKHEIFGNTKVNGDKLTNTFREEDAKRFIAAVKARKAGMK